MNEPTISSETRDEFWEMWRRLRLKVPFKSRNELQAADHAAWMVYREMKDTQKPKSENQK